MIDGRIPTEAPAGLSGGAEIRHASAPGERSASGAVDLALDNGLALHVDGFRRKTSDLRIPGHARSARLREIDPLPPGDEEARSRLTNSASDSDGAAVGVAWTGPRGGLGASVARYATDYGTVAEGGRDDPDEADADRRRGGLAVSVRSAALDQGPIRSLGLRAHRVRGRRSRYRLRSRGYELRVDAAHARIGPFEGAFGVQALDFDFSALGAEGFLPRTATKGFAAFLYEEAKIDRWKLGLGLRYDRVRVSADDDERFGPGLVRTFNAGSASIGGTYEVGKHTAIVASVVASRRPPTYQELYADGPHVATGLIEIGDRSLGLEKAVGVDLAARRKAGPLTGSVGVYWNRFATTSPCSPPVRSIRTRDCRSTLIVGHTSSASRRKASCPSDGSARATSSSKCMPTDYGRRTTIRDARCRGSRPGASAGALLGRRIAGARSSTSCASSGRTGSPKTNCRPTATRWSISRSSGAWTPVAAGWSPSSAEPTSSTKRHATTSPSSRTWRRSANEA